MRYEIKSLGIWSFVKVSFFLHLVIGFVLGLFYAALLMMVFAVASSAPLDEMGGLPFDLQAVGPLLMIILPIAMAVGGAVFGTLFGVLVVAAYNLIARMAGGVEFDFEPVVFQQVSSNTQTGYQPVSTPTFVAPPPPPPTSDPPRNDGPGQA
ncbi:MAG: hypothetical protein NTW07_06260 [candidate division Zixibacteria bacterium]|nr:hypothetical protein [candidate division Zixibacteria bacterium]